MIASAEGIADKFHADAFGAGHGGVKIFSGKDGGGVELWELGESFAARVERVTRDSFLATGVGIVDAHAELDDDGTAFGGFL